MYQIWIGYLLWFFGGFGCFGFHRLYLRKVPTGILWMFTGGLGLVGAAYDFFTLPRQVEEANARLGLGREDRGPREVTIRREKEPLERVILRLAQSHGGRVTAVQVAASSDWTVDQAQKHLDEMTRRRICEMRVLSGGTVVYFFADFDPAAGQDFEV